MEDRKNFIFSTFHGTFFLLFEQRTHVFILFWATHIIELALPLGDTDVSGQQTNFESHVLKPDRSEFNCRHYHVLVVSVILGVP